MTTVEERASHGRAVRALVPRSAHAEPAAAAGRDPVALIESENATRLAELVPIRCGRMLASPLAFFRGAAAVMANDLASRLASGLTVQLSGDAHLLNFGGFATPERNLVFDLDDFDETVGGPFEWDVKRLAASLEIAGRERNFARTERSTAVQASVRSYREAMRSFAAMGDLDVWYAHLDAQTMLERLRAEHDTELEKTLARKVAKARSNDGRRALATLAHRVDGKVEIVSKPPVIVPLAELSDGAESDGHIRSVFQSYRRSLTRDRRVLLDRFRLVSVARKVVGIGSVGTRCWLLLLLGRDQEDPLFLQVKEARPPTTSARRTNHGRRVVEGQRLLQASSDIFLGWIRGEGDVDGERRDYYVRQLREWKMSLDPETILPRGLSRHGAACGWTLARAHARSGDRIAIAGYLGAGDAFDRALTDFAYAYADLNERDHGAFAAAARAGRIAAVEGV